MKTTQSSPPESPTGERSGAQIVTLVRSGYKSYRNWRKARGRRAKARKHLQSMMKFYSQFVKPGDQCFDVGANLGNRTEAFLKLGAYVVAIEPQADCAQTLREKSGFFV